ncbi:MAG: CRP/FNR family transcriptional regulator [Flavobacteriales bacterium]|jgi:CRP/FNR family transcriptional regulator
MQQVQKQTFSWALSGHIKWRGVTGPLWEEAISKSAFIEHGKAEGLNYLNSNPERQGFAILMSGAVSIYGSCESGKGLCLSRLRAGDICPLALGALMGTVASEACVRSDTAISLLVMPKSFFQMLLAGSEPFRDLVLGEYSFFANELIKVAKEVSFLRLPVRVARSLLRGVGEGDSITLTHQTLADELGTTREVVSRHLKELERRGWIKLYRGGLELKSKDDLLGYAFG